MPPSVGPSGRRRALLSPCRRTAHDRDIVMAEYVTYDNATHPYRTLGLETPEGPRTVQRAGAVMAIPVLGGLHHRYHQVAT